MQQDRFYTLVCDALAHVYEQSYLQTHPLATSLAVESAAITRGQQLQTILLDAIKELRPRGDVSYESLAWRKYRYMDLRYVETLGVGEIADDLSVSVRQCRRYWHEGLAALTSILWDRYHEKLARPIQESVKARDDGSFGADDAFVEEEATRIIGEAATEATPVSDVISGVVATIGPLLAKREQEITLELSPDLPDSTIMRTALRQVVLNLLSLVSDAAHESQGGEKARILVTTGLHLQRIEIELSWLPASPEFSCSDGTPGAWSEFASQLSKWRVARSILAGQEGEIRAVCSADGAPGIAVTLPVASAASILIVEDNPDVIKLFERYLGDTCYRVLATANGDEAIQLAFGERPAAITLDVMMPGQDGWEILQTLKSRPETSAIPVIVCSVLQEEDLARALGADGFLPKPVRRQQLLEALASALTPAISPAVGAKKPTDTT